MKKQLAVKFAVSALAIGATMVACKPVGHASRPASLSARAPQAVQQAGAFHEKAVAAQGKGNFAEALRFAEQAVELSPRDSGYRLLLADLYLKNGRFQSAETSFADVLALDPGNGRAGLGSALAQIANGNTGAAMSRLDAMAGAAPAADIGLAYALAGHPQRAIELLEPAARAAGATPRVRQNLALAHALNGDWQKAQAIAAQDVSPADLAQRMQQWASLSKPAAPWTQVASLLGVTAVVDHGQPVRLALAPASSDTAYAAADTAEPTPEPAQAAPEAAPEPAPVRYAAAEPPAPSQPAVSDWGRAPQPQSAPAAEEVERPVYAQAIESLVAPRPGLARASVDVDTAPVIAFPQRQQRFTAQPAPRSGGRFVVQLGAFSSAAGVERAWAQAYRRYGFASRTPLSTTIAIAGRGTFHRLSVAGFGSHADASRACQSVKAKGGACFVRTVAGDAPTRWASRYMNRPA